MLNREDSPKALADVELLQERLSVEGAWEHDGNVAR